MEMTITQKAPSDLHEHIARLTERGLITRIDRAIDKDSELHPLARWQFQGGLRDGRRLLRAVPGPPHGNAPVGSRNACRGMVGMR